MNIYLLMPILMGGAGGWFTLHRSTTLEMLHDHIITRCMLQLKKKHAGNSITGFNSVVLSIKPFIHFKCCGANIPECHCQSSPPESVSWTNKNYRRQCGSVDSALEGVWITATLATVCPNFLSRCITTRNGWIVPRSPVWERCTVLNKQGLRSVLQSSPQYTPLNNCFSHSNDWEFEIPQTLPTTKTWRFAYLPNDDGDDDGGGDGDGNGDGDGGDDQLEFHLLPLSCWLDII